MGDVVEFKPLSKNKQQQKRKKQQTGKGQHTLCKEGHHKWEIVQEKRFETHSGKLTTVYRCSRCGKTKTELH